MARYFVTERPAFSPESSPSSCQPRPSAEPSFAIQQASLLRTLGVQLHQGDITDRESLRAPMTGVDGVFHCAAWYKVGVDPAESERTNVDGTRHVLGPCARWRFRAASPGTARCSRTRAGRCRRVVALRGPHLGHYDRTKWPAHYEVALPMMARACR